MTREQLPETVVRKIEEMVDRMSRIASPHQMFAFGEDCARLAIQTRSGPCLPVCGLASSTYVDEAGDERCDLCGHIAEQPRAGGRKEGYE